MDTNSLLVLIIGLLTLNLLFVGVYIVLVLKEVRESIRSINRVLDQVARVSESVSTPIVGASGMLAGLLEGLKIFKRFKSLRPASPARFDLARRAGGKEVENE